MRNLLLVTIFLLSLALPATAQVSSRYCEFAPVECYGYLTVYRQQLESHLGGSSLLSSLTDTEVYSLGQQIVTIQKTIPMDQQWSYFLKVLQGVHGIQGDIGLAKEWFTFQNSWQEYVNSF